MCQCWKSLRLSKHREYFNAIQVSFIKTFDIRKFKVKMNYEKTHLNPVDFMRFVLFQKYSGKIL